MQLSTEGLELIKKSEGFRDHVYRDVAGFPTIGYGHLVKPDESFPNGVTESQAASILAADVQQAEQAVARLVKVALTQGQFDALVDFCFNLGAGRLAGSTLLRELNAAIMMQPLGSCSRGTMPRAWSTPAQSPPRSRAETLDGRERQAEGRGMNRPPYAPRTKL